MRVTKNSHSAGLLMTGITLIFGISLIAVLSLSALSAQAQTYNSLEFTPQVQIQGTGVDQPSIKVGEYKDGAMTSNLLAQYIKAFYDYGMAAAGILAAIVLMAGGVLWLTSGGNDSKIGQAKELIAGSITGVLILFSAWIILNTINPQLLELKVIKTDIIPQINMVCCEHDGKAEILRDDICGKKSGKIFQNSADSFGVVSTYSVDQSGKKCTLPGCCLSRENGQPNGKILWCSNTMYHNCSAGYFMNKNCQYVQQEMDANGSISSCQGRTDTCATAKDGEDCADSIDGYCYNKLCWHNKGLAGQPCGNELNSKCDADEQQGGRSCEQDQGGRSCSSGLWCCKFKDNGDRLNK